MTSLWIGQVTLSQLNSQTQASLVSCPMGGYGLAGRPGRAVPDSVSPSPARNVDVVPIFENLQIQFQR